MKFYNDKYSNISYYWNKIMTFEIEGIINSVGITWIFKNGVLNNTKNASVSDGKNKSFYLNGRFYGYGLDFTKQSWRRFVKLQAFL
jgi:hypothetical protein